MGDYVTVDAVRIRERYVGRVIEYATTVTPAMAYDGLGDAGDAVHVRGWLLAVVKGANTKRSWVSLVVQGEVVDHPDSPVTKFSSDLTPDHPVRVATPTAPNGGA